MINLDEAFWGGDKKLEGSVKNKITEGKQSINKKNINHYNINDFCNYIITTNSDWFAGVDEGDRRYYCTELSNEFAGRATAKTEAYYAPILAVSPESFAKVLYNWDISDFNPGKFKKTRLLQDQVEWNHNSVKAWWNMVMKDGGFIFGDKFITYNELMKSEDGGYKSFVGGEYIKNKKVKGKKTAYHKDWIFNVYNSHSADARKFSNSAFYRELQKNCLEKLYNEIRVQKKKERRIYVLLPDIDVAREKWNELQEFDYDYDDDADPEFWILDGCDISD